MDLLNIFVSLLALVLLEVILGIDNLVFLAILTEKLPVSERRKARRLGLMFAWVMRLLLLFSALVMVHLTHPLFVIFETPFSIRSIFLLLGGGFLIFKATQEIHAEVYEDDSDVFFVGKASSQMRSVIVQVGLMDLVFSIDSILTAVGLTDHFMVMATAITIAILAMIYASEPIAKFIHKYPTIKMLALSFLMLIGMVLVADGFSFHIPRGYVYFAMGFSLGVESLHWAKRSYRERTKRKRK